MSSAERVAFDLANEVWIEVISEPRRDDEKCHGAEDELHSAALRLIMKLCTDGEDASEIYNVAEVALSTRSFHFNRWAG